MTPDDGGVVVLVNQGWIGFEQLGLRLQRMGVGVAHLSVGPWSARRVQHRLWFKDQRECDLSDLTAEFQRIGPEKIVDVLCSEETAAAALEAARQAGLTAPVIEELRRRVLWGDKLDWSVRLSGTPFRVPTTLEIEGGSGSDKRLPVVFPVVVKPRVGAGGEGVRLVQDETELRDLATSSLESGSFVVQEAREGRVCQYVAAYRDGEILLDSTYESTSRSNQQFGPGSEAQLLYDRDLRALGRDLLCFVGGRGLANIETILDNEGRHWIIDVNLRPWGLCCAYRGVGYNFDEAYLACLNGVGFPAPNAPRSFRISLFPVASRVRLVDTGFWQSLRHFLRAAPQAFRDFGSMYTAWAALGFLGRFVTFRTRGTQGV